MGRRNAGRPTTREAVAPPPQAVFGQARLRLLVAVLLFLLVGYTAWTGLAVLRSGDADLAGHLAPQARLLAAQADGRMARLHAAADAGAAVLKLQPDEPLAAAEAAARVARASGLDEVSVAVVGAEGVTAQTGAHIAAGPWSAPASAPGRPLPRGASGRVIAWSGDGGRGRLAVFAAAPAPSSDAVLATADLDLLTGEAGRLDDALGVDRSAIAAAAAKGGLLTLAGPMQGRSAVVAQEGGVLAAVTAATPAGAVGPRDVVRLAAPLLVGALLLGLLLSHSSRQAAAGVALDESARRFRLAVEAARCGIWEWRLRDRQMVMSDVMGAMLGWGGAGVVSTEEVLARITPEHRERVRQALAAATTFGSFDVSFGVHTDRGPVWIEDRKSVV